MQINNVRARRFLLNASIFTHFFGISAHTFVKKVVILQRDLISRNVHVYVMKTLYRVVIESMSVQHRSNIGPTSRDKRILPHPIIYKYIIP